MRLGRIQAEFDARRTSRKHEMHARGLRSRLVSPGSAPAAPERVSSAPCSGLLALCVVLWILTPHFLTVSNLLNVLEQSAINAIVAAGMTFVIISGGIDLSVGSVLALSGDRCWRACCTPASGCRSP